MIVGSQSTSGIAYLGDKNRRHLDEQSATRLIVSEIEKDQRRLGSVLAFGTLPRHEALDTEEWGREQSTLARSLNDKEWSSTARFYADLDSVDELLAANRCLRNTERRIVFVSIRTGNNAIRALGKGTPYVAPPVIASCGT